MTPTIAPDYRLERVFKPQHREIEKPKLRLIILLSRENSYIPAEGRQPESWAEY